ncbi:DEAD/DEAH box helicase family protein [Ekhidna sp.]
MKTFPENIIFKYPWRNYQQRVLDELDEHLEDDHLHVIAPPGSGKTVLGLEVMIRLDKPTLILAPTIAIRNQWVERFCELFLQVEKRPNWISLDIKNPKLITVSTYQGLHAACTDSKAIEDEFEELEDESSIEDDSDLQPSKLDVIIQTLKEAGLGTIVVDEAHHLKNAWWKSLIQIKDNLSPIIVGLTATPPYDVSYTEWSRYIELNGPVDTEISVPELIKEGDLCPHQDYILVSEPTESELEKIKEYRKITEDIFERLSQDEFIVGLLNSSELIKSPEAQLDWIYSNMEYYSAILIYLNHNDIAIEDRHVKITGNKPSKLPKLSKEWLELLLEFYLKKHDSEDEKVIKHQKETSLILRKAGVMERGRINFTDDSKIEKFLTSSLGKLESINRITEFESNHLKDDLRQVILGDFIRKEYLSDSVEINKLGVIPIFESLRRKKLQTIKIGVLTGSLIIIPKTALSKLTEVSSKYGIDKIRTKPLEYDQDYLIVNVNDKMRHDIVHIVTQTFESGEITVLVGTKSLLGEGWDAPSINALILASFVGSFVLSNQMRGRAIRTVRSNHKKTGNIWHLACSDPTSSGGGKDLETLNRRFKSFVGISERENRTIENGLNRLMLPKTLDLASANSFNQRMFSSAADRELLKNQWHEAIENGNTLVEEIKIPFEEEKDYKTLKNLYLNKTIKYVLVELGLSLSFYAHEFMGQLPRLRSLFRTQEGRWTILAFFVLGAFAFFGRKLYLAFRLFVKYRDISKDIDHIGNALLRTLIDSKHIHSDISELKVESAVNQYGEVFCHLEGGTTFEKAVFIKALQEIVTPVDNPRYLIIRKSTFLSLFNQKDYHPVPDVLGKHKSLANQLASFWKDLVGNCSLIFTRNPEGRAILLKARFNSLASEFHEKVERTNRWK